jgi:hypothetical protein
MICPECGKTLTNEEDCYGHDCEAFVKVTDYGHDWEKPSIRYVQIVDRNPKKGLTVIGQPVRLSLALQVKKELFGDAPNIILMPSVPPKELNKNYKKKLEEVS